MERKVYPAKPKEKCSVDGVKMVFDIKVSKKEKEALTRIFNWCIEQLYSVNRSDKGANNTAKINALEDKITEMVEVLPKLKYMKKEIDPYCTKTIAELAASKQMVKLLKECCAPAHTVLVKGDSGFTMLEHLAIHFNGSYTETEEDRKILQKIILNALEDEKVLKYTNSRGENFGMFCVSHLKECPELIPVVEKYILNPETATMQDGAGYNIGMECARFKQQELFELAYKNPVARLQRNNKGETMALIANNNGILVPPLTEDELYEKYTFIYEELLKNFCK